MLKDRISNVLDSYAEIALKNPDAVNLLKEVYAELFSKPLEKDCKQCLVKAFRKIQRKAFMLNNMTMKSSDQKYQLRDGVTLDLKPGVLSPENITDEKVESLLALYPHMAKHFKTLPEEKSSDKKASKE